MGGGELSLCFVRGWGGGWGGDRPPSKKPVANRVGGGLCPGLW